MTRPARPQRTPRARPYLRVFVALAAGALLRLPARGAEAPAPRIGPPLHDGFTFEHALAPGEVYAFPVEMQAGEYLRAEVDQIGIDVVVRLVDEAGKEIAQADSVSIAPTNNEREHLTALSSATGPHQLRVEAPEGAKSVLPSRALFRIRVAGPRTATSADRAFLQANLAIQRASVLCFQAKQTDDHSSYKAAAQLLDRTIPILREMGEEDTLAYALLWSGTAKHEGNLGGWAEAVAQLDEATTIYRKPKNRELVQQLESSLQWSAFVLGRLHAWGTALPRINEALEIAVQVDDQPGVRLLHTLQGRAYSGLGDFDEADRLLNISLSECKGQQELGTCEAKVLSGIYLAFAANFTDWGRYQDALSFYATAAVQVHESNIPWLEEVLSNNLGELYGRLGEQRKALSLYSEAAAIAHRLEQPDDEAVALANAAAAHRFLGEISEAKRIYEQALIVPGASPISISNALHSLAYLYAQDRGDPRQAVELADRAIETSGTNLLQEAYGRHVKAYALRLLKRTGEARSELARVLTICREIKERILEAEAQLTLGRIDRDEGHLEASRDDVLAAIQLVETMRQGIRFNPSLRASFLAFRQAQYEFYIDSLMLLNKANPNKGYLEGAFDASETARARTLLESLERLPAWSTQASSPENQKRLQALSKSIGEIQLDRQVALSEGRQITSREDHLAYLDDLLLKYEAELGQIQQSASARVPLHSARPLPLKEIRSRVLGHDVVLLEYSLGKEKSYLWVVRSDSIAAFQLPPRNDIEKVVRRYYDLLTIRNRRLQETSRAARGAAIRQADSRLRLVSLQLSGILLQPAANLLRVWPSTTLVVGDGALHYIPFAALPFPGGGQPLIRRTRVVHLPSASTLAAIRDFSRPSAAFDRPLAIFAAPAYGKSSTSSPGLFLPALPWAEKEALRIASLVPSGKSAVYLDTRASRENLEALDLSQFAVLHFGTHGLVDSEHPELSALALSLVDPRGAPKDGYLRLAEIYGLRLNAELVTLSACRTAIGKEIRGEGLVGLARGFMAAGAKRVLASLWSVEDRATAELMQSFYRGLLVTRLTPSEALRRAQLEMLRTPQYASPYYWAAFTLQGEWQ